MTVRASRLGIASIAALVLAGCGHTESHVALLRAPQVANNGNVELYIADQPGPTRPFYDVAMVQAIGFGSDANPAAISQTLTERAAALGCDAVVRTYIDVGYSRAHGAGVCVKFTGPAPSGVETPPSTLPPPPARNPRPPPVRLEPAPRIEPLPSSPDQGG